MKKGAAAAIVLILCALPGAAYFLSRTPAVRVAQPSSVSLTPAGASVVVHFENAGDAREGLQQLKSVRELLASGGMRALENNFLMPVFRAYIPVARFSPSPDALLKFLSRDATVSVTTDDEDSKSFLLVTRISTLQKIKFKALKLLMSLKGIIREKRMGNVPAYEMKTPSGKTFFWSLMGDYFFLSNREKRLKETISNALKITANPLSDCLLFVLASNTGGTPPVSVFRFYENASGKRMAESFHFTGQGQSQEEKLTFAANVSSEGGAGVPPRKKTYFSAAAPYLPKETVFFSHLDFAARLFHGESVASLISSEATSEFSKEVLKLDMTHALLPLLSGSCMVAFSKILKLADGTPVPDFTFIFPLNSAVPQKKLLSVVDTLFARSMKDVYKKHTEKLYGTAIVSFLNDSKGYYAALSPSYAVTGGFLFVALTRETLEKILAVKKGYLPCIQDAENFRRIAVPANAQFYFFASGEGAPAAVKDYLTQVLDISSGFMEKEIKTGLIPASRELRRFSFITGAFASTEQNLMEGTVEFVFRKN